MKRPDGRHMGEALIAQHAGVVQEWDISCHALVPARL